MIDNDTKSNNEYDQTVQDKTPPLFTVGDCRGASGGSVEDKGYVTTPEGKLVAVAWGAGGSGGGKSAEAGKMLVVEHNKVVAARSRETVAQKCREALRSEYQTFGPDYIFDYEDLCVLVGRTLEEHGPISAFISHEVNCGSLAVVKIHGDTGRRIYKIINPAFPYMARKTNKTVAIADVANVKIDTQPAPKSVFDVSIETTLKPTMVELIAKSVEKLVQQLDQLKPALSTFTLDELLDEIKSRVGR